MAYKLLPSSKAIRLALSQLFTKATRKRRRVILSAYVGAEAPSLLPDVDRIELYCWPQAGATNPHALRTLESKGVKISFADRLHMKVYWVAGKGAVIGSANLSTNALGVGGLSECGVLIPARDVEIDALIRSVSHRPMTEPLLAKLQKQHDLFWSRNRALVKRSAAPTPPQSFSQWAARPRSFPWRLTWWDFEGNEAESTAKAVEHDFGSELDDFIDCTKNNQFTEGDWVLLYQCLKNNRPGKLSWFFISGIYPVPVKERTEAIYTHQAVQVGSLRGRRPPFQLTPSFQHHFSAAVMDYGAKKLADQGSTEIPPALLKDIMRRCGLTTA